MAGKRRHAFFLRSPAAKKKSFRALCTAAPCSILTPNGLPEIVSRQGFDMPGDTPKDELDLFIDKPKRSKRNKKTSANAASDSAFQAIHEAEAPAAPEYPGYVSLADRPDDFAQVFLGVDMAFARQICREDLFDIDKRENGQRIVDKIQALAGVNAENVILALDGVEARIQAGEIEESERIDQCNLLIQRETRERILEALPELAPGRIKISPNKVLQNFLLNSVAGQPRAFSTALQFFGGAAGEPDTVRAEANFQAFALGHVPEIAPLFDGKQTNDRLRPLLMTFFSAMKNIYRCKRKMLQLEQNVAESIDVFRKKLHGLAQEAQTSSDALRAAEQSILCEFERASVGLLAIREQEEIGLARCFGAGVFLARSWPAFFEALNARIDEAFVDMRRRAAARDAGGVRVRFHRGEGGKWKKFLVTFSFGAMMQNLRRLDPDSGEPLEAGPTLLQERLRDLRLEDIPPEVSKTLAEVDYQSPRKQRALIAKLASLAPAAEQLLQAAKELKAAKRQEEDPSEQEANEANATQKISRLKRELADFARTLDLMLGRRSRVVLQEAEKRLGEEAGRRLAQLMAETASGPAFYQTAAEDTAQRVFLAKVQAMREQDKLEDEPVVRKINELVGKRAENGAPGGFAAQIDQFSEVRIRSEEGRQAFVEVDIDMLTVLVLLWKPPKAVAEAGRAVEQEREDDMARKRVGFIMGLIIRKIFKYISARGWDEELRLFAANAGRLRASPRRSGDRSRELGEAESKTLEQLAGFVERLRIIREALVSADLVENFGSGAMDRLFQLNPEQGANRRNMQFFEAYLRYATRLGDRTGPGGEEEVNIPILIQDLNAAGYPLPTLIEAK